MTSAAVAGRATAGAATPTREQSAAARSTAGTTSARHWPAARLAISALLCVVAIQMVLFKLDVFPQIGSDEWWLLGRNHTFLHDVTFADTVAMDMEMRDSSTASILPVNLFPRYAIDSVLGLGVESARRVSAVQFIVVGAAFAVIAWRLGAPLAVALLGLPVFLLTPSVFFVARTYRYEQDLFFLGSLAIVLSLPLLRPTRYWLPLAMVSGTFAGMVSVMHIFGAGFTLAILGVAGVAWLLNGRGRTRPDWRVVGVWLACAAAPVAFTVIYFVAGMDTQTSLAMVTRSREAQQLEDRMAFLRSLYPAPIPGLPNRVLETWNALRWGLAPISPAVAPGLTLFVLSGLGLLAAAVVYVGLTTVVLRRIWRLRQVRPLDAQQAALLTLGLLAVAQLLLTAIRPHTDYTVHVHGAVILTVFLLIATAGARGRGDARWWQHPTVRWLALVGIILVQVGYLGPVLANRTEPAGVALASQVRAMAAVSRAVGIDLDDASGLAVYGDLPSWGATGRRHAPLFDYLILERVDVRPSFTGVVFDAEWLNTMVGKIAPSTGDELDPERRRARMATVLDGLELSAVMRIDPNTPRNPNIRFWYLRDAPPAPVFGIVDPNGALTLYDGQAVADRRAAVGAGPVRTGQRLRLDAGEYFALVSGTGRATTRIQASYGREELNGSALDNFPQEQGGGRLWLTLARPTDVRFFLDTDGAVPGEVRLRVWRVRDAAPDR